MTAALPIGVVIRTIEADRVSWLERRAWLAVGRDLVGQRVQARVERTRGALAGADAQLDLWFAEGRRTDPSWHSVPSRGRSSSRSRNGRRCASSVPEDGHTTG
ncbi:MAG: hypothetical protein ACRD2W_22780 [Acidimicrobiales bacterium]